MNTIETEILSKVSTESSAGFNVLDLLHEYTDLKERLEKIPWARNMFGSFSERPEIDWKAAHVVRVAATALRVADYSLRFGSEELDIITAAAITHDNGFLDERIKSVTINKVGELSPGERKELDQHSLYSAEMTTRTGSYLGIDTQQIARVVAHHHQRQRRLPDLDGKLPELLPEDEKFAILLAICDQVDAIASKGMSRESLKGRPYTSDHSPVNENDAIQDISQYFPGYEEIVKVVVRARYQL